VRFSAIGQATAFCNFVPTMGALHEGHLSLHSPRQPCSSQSAGAEPVQPGCLSERVRVPTSSSGRRDFQPLTPADFSRPMRNSSVAGGPRSVCHPPLKIFFPGGEASVTRVIHAGVPCLRDSLRPIRPGHFDGVATVIARLGWAVDSFPIALLARREGLAAIVWSCAEVVAALGSAGAAWQGCPTWREGRRLAAVLVIATFPRT